MKILLTQNGASIILDAFVSDVDPLSEPSPIRLLRGHREFQPGPMLPRKLWGCIKGGSMAEEKLKS